jgi:hypothetical protein
MEYQDKSSRLELHQFRIGHTTPSQVIDIKEPVGWYRIDQVTKISNIFANIQQSDEPYTISRSLRIEANTQFQPNSLVFSDSSQENLSRRTQQKRILI